MQLYLWWQAKATAGSMWATLALYLSPQLQCCTATHSQHISALLSHNHDSGSTSALIATLTITTCRLLLHTM